MCSFTRLKEVQISMMLIRKILFFVGEPSEFSTNITNNQWIFAEFCERFAWERQRRPRFRAPLPQHRGTPRFGAYHIKKRIRRSDVPFPYLGIHRTGVYRSLYRGIRQSGVHRSEEGVTFRYTPAKGVVFCDARTWGRETRPHRRQSYSPRSMICSTSLSSI